MLRNEIFDKLAGVGQGVRRDEVNALANFARAQRDTIVSCEGLGDMVTSQAPLSNVPFVMAGEPCRKSGSFAPTWERIPAS